LNSAEEETGVNVSLKNVTSRTPVPVKVLKMRRTKMNLNLLKRKKVAKKLAKMVARNSKKIAKKAAKKSKTAVKKRKMTEVTTLLTPIVSQPTPSATV